VPPGITVPDGYAFDRLDAAHHCREHFSCGKEPLDTFLRTQAAQAQGKNLSATHVVVRTEANDAGLYPIAGYVTLVSTEIPIADCPPALKKVTNKARLPILLLARMATDTAHKGKRIGEFLLKFALVKAQEMKQSSGCVATFVDAKDNDSKNFYVKYGFIPLPENSMRLYLEMAVIERLG
jgi:predicted GNAT family N-acyltransferase